jgi:hypothetical protein
VHNVDDGKPRNDNLTAVRKVKMSLVEVMPTVNSEEVEISEHHGWKREHVDYSEFDLRITDEVDAGQQL